MQLNEKLQQLRKGKGLTQEDLASALYVSRTAVSKWESGRGTPNIDSLKAIADFFSVSVDDLLSADELLTVAEEETKRKTAHLRDLVFGLWDMSTALFFFLPLFGQTYGVTLQEVSLLSLTVVAPYMRVVYLSVVALLILLGVLTLALQNVTASFWLKAKRPLSLILGGAGVLVFILGSQPYAAAYLFVLLVIKALLLLKKN